MNMPLAKTIIGTFLASILLSLLLVWPASAQQPPAPERPLVFVPGLLGSSLCRPGADGQPIVVWGSIDALGHFPSLAVDSDANEIVPCGLLREISFLGIFSQTVYAPIVERLEAAGYREGETLFVFDYDWRLSVFDNAELLAAFVDAELPGGGAFDVLAHSMGGLIARTYALEEGGADRIARLISAGTPWRGSVQVFELLRDGWGLANNFMGGLDGFRRTVASFPSTFEMIPHYEGCCASGTAAGFDATSAEAWSSLNWSGIAGDALPDLAEVAARQARLRRIIAQALPATIEEALVIGVDQRTPEHYELLPGENEARLEVRTSWEGDGTVMRDSARLPQRVTYPTSFATHDAILSDAAVQDFVLAALAQGPDAAIATVPVRERTDIFTALGALVELVGVAIETDQPAYRTGSTGKVTVHLRLDVEDPVDTDAIRMSIVRPDGPALPVPLAPDPQASDPSNPFEQSFSGEFETGAGAGGLAVTVTLDAADGEPRIATRIVPVLAQ